MNDSNAPAAPALGSGFGPGTGPGTGPAYGPPHGPLYVPAHGAVLGVTEAETTVEIAGTPVIGSQQSANPWAEPRGWTMPPRPGPAAPQWGPPPPPRRPGEIEAEEISAWFGDRKVLDRVSLNMPAGKVTALIGPSGCGKSTFLRILNRMHELVPRASLAGRVLLDGRDVYDPQRRLTEARSAIGMVFQKPNPFPAMSLYDNVVAGLKLTGRRASRAEKDSIVEECLTRSGLWNEVRDRLRQPGGALSGGQQQRLCIARALAVRPEVLLMDEPCSALDPTSTRRIEETIGELASEVTIVIVTHNMQQAARVSAQCAFFLAEQGTPGRIVEYGPTKAMFGSPKDPRTADYVNGRFG
jgi:phosphate transport system ATP-binding protein